MFLPKSGFPIVENLHSLFRLTIFLVCYLLWPLQAQEVALDTARQAESDPWQGHLIIPGKSGLPSIDTLPIHEWDVATDNKDLGKVLLFGLLFPGGAQFYTGHNVRGGFLLGLQSALAFDVFYNKPMQQRRRREMARTSLDTLRWITEQMIAAPAPDSLTQWEAMRRRNLQRVRQINDKKLAEEDLRRSEMAWMVGLHLYGIMDGYGIWRFNKGRSYEKREVKSALWRGAVLPGWGQIYNGEFGKAGLLYMAIIGSVVSFNSRQTMVEHHLERLQVARRENFASSEIAEISEDLVFFRKKRNQYSWGLALFYFYSLADAAVGAILSDFDSPINLAIYPQLGGLGAQVSFPLGLRVK